MFVSEGMGFLIFLVVLVLFGMGLAQFSGPRQFSRNCFYQTGASGAFCSFFPRKNCKTKSSLNFLESGPQIH